MSQGLLIAGVAAIVSVGIGINITSAPHAATFTSLEQENHELRVTYDLPMLENVRIINLGTGEVIQERIKVQISEELSEEQFYLAATMWGEARGEGKTGMAYVGHVIKNRADAGFRGNDIKSVVLKRKQFSCWNRNDPNRPKLNLEYLENTTGEEKIRWEQAKKLSGYILNGSKDYTNGALHYHARSVTPNWKNDYKVAVIFKSHIFYR